jgi:AcrR family transcriptional regulator
MRTQLLASGARLLAEQGPSALTTRRVATDAGTSTMSVYTQFGSIDELVRAVVDDGFARLAIEIAAVVRTDDPVADLAALTNVYVDYARQNPNLYAVMFGTASLGPFRRTTYEDLQAGRSDVFDEFVAICGLAISVGRFAPADAWVLAHQWWSAIHGYIMLENAGYVRPPSSVAKVLSPLLVNVLVGLGDSREEAAASVATVREFDPSGGQTRAQASASEQRVTPA